ncbi:hypothetical protein CHISP_1582 [Chitinispirillum alkaliphilum]|nr:hypothetical protein CHISP_1582 [Chitinispirillum alkaliphilum]
MKPTFFCILAFLAFSAYSDNTIFIEQHGRPISPDGFLLEWNSAEAREWQDEWVWDAINTPEGPAGYFSTQNKNVCPEWIFSFSSLNENLSLIVQIPPAKRYDNFAINDQLYEEVGAINFEWVIPWEMLETDSDGKYEMVIDGFSACGDSLQSLILRGQIQENGTAIFTPMMMIQAVLIAILLVVYIFVRRWVKRQTDRRESPRRST